MCRALRRHGIGQMLDVVPNHMGVLEADNAWWLDVLEHGPASLHAETFDIEWQSAEPGMEGRVLLPVLGDHYGKVLDAGELRPEPGNLHRLLRRGRPFASTGAADDRVPPAQPAAEVGMFFIAVVADLSRQFEFVKRAWIGNARFGNLCGEVDPLLGRASGRHFTMPGHPTGSRVHALPDLTRTQGGGYFFMPALGTLKRIAAGDYTTASEEGAC